MTSSLFTQKSFFLQSINNQDTLMLLSQRTTITYEKRRMTIFLDKSYA